MKKTGGRTTVSFDPGFTRHSSRNPFRKLRRIGSLRSR